MPTTPSTTTVISDRYRTPVYLALIAAGLAGNYFKFPIFFSTDFIFGSIFAMLALQFFGLWRGILAAAIISSYTWFIWNHPYAIIILTAEVAVAGLLMKRRRIGLIQADALFWLLAGMPLVYLVYHFVLKIPNSNVLFIITKLAVNGVANVLITRILFFCYAFWSRSSLISLREIVYNLLLFFVLCPTLVMLAAEGRSDFRETDLNIRTTLLQDSKSVEQSLKNWVNNRITAIADLAEMAATQTPQQMQPYLERAKRADANFLYVALRDRDATTTAVFPLLDERGGKRIGLNYADRGYFPQLKQTLRPMLSEMVISKASTPQPRIQALAPVVVRGEFRGFVAGSMDLEQIREYLNTSIGSRSERYTLIDINGNVIMSNRPDQKIMMPFERGKGTLDRLDAGISRWLPAVPPNTPYFERWKKSYYVSETAIGNPAEWRLVLELPVAPFQKALYVQYSRKLTLLFLILLVTLALAGFLSRKIVDALHKLRSLTHELPARLITDGTEIEWPESGIKEVNHLINNFREMASTLSAQFIETRRIAEEMRESRQQLLDIIDFFPEATFVLDNEKRVIVWNSAMEKMTGISKEEMAGKGDYAYTIPFYGEKRPILLDLLDLDDDELVSQYHDVLMENNTLHAETFCPALYGGKGAFVWAVAAPLFNLKGERVGAIESIRDTTERRQTQEALKQAYAEVEQRVRERTSELDATNSALMVEIAERKQAEDALRKSEALYHSLVETSQDLIWRCDSEGRYTYLNLAWEQVFGYELDDMLGRKFTDFQTPGNAAFDLHIFNQLMHGDMVDRYESVYRGKSGNEIHLVFNAQFIPNEHNQITGTGGTAYDITHRKQLENELVESTEKILEQHDTLLTTQEMLRVQIEEYKAVQAQLLEAKAAAEAASIAKSRFLSTMSHEIRTPMNGVIGMIELLQHTGLTQEQQEYAERAKKSGNNLVRLLNDILDISKIEADRIELERSDFDLRQMISDTIDIMSLQAVEKGVELTSTIDDGVPTALNGDAGRLRQIIINLVGNAIKFTFEGSVELVIRKDSEDQHCVTLRYQVRDSGIGIAPGKLDQIFEPFTQADGSTSRKFGGTGLGLTICRKLAELMGGEIGVESAVGQGSTFWFTVVMEKQTGLSSGALSPAREKTIALPLNRELESGEIRILLAEDEPNAQLAVPRLLKSYGYLVDVAGNGREALRALEENSYELVLMDCMMPEMNGFEATSVIRDPASAVKRHDIPVIALTGNAMKQDYDDCLSAGMDDHLPKPLKLDDLLNMLDKWLDR